MSTPTTSGELICDHVSEAGPTVTHVRGALLVSSLQVLKEVGLYTRYVDFLAPEYSEQVLFALAMSWVPVDVAAAHYRACDALGLSEQELVRIAEALSRRYADSIFGTMLRTSRQAGIDGPWLALRAQGRIWDRVYQGGSVRCYKTGPKDAILEQRGQPLAAISYYRSAHLLWLKAISELVVRKMHIRLLRPSDADDFSLSFSGSWV